MNQHNIICLDLEIGNSIEPEHVYNILVISKNLADFNNRFNTDIKLNYDVDDYMFTPIDEDDEYVIWFCEGISELLAFAHSPTSNDEFDLNEYLDNRRKEINYLQKGLLFDQYKKRYIDYAPLGFLFYDSEDYIKSRLTDLILDKENEL